MEDEKWEVIKGASKYLLSNHGRVRRISKVKGGKLHLKNTMAKNGVLRINITKDTGYRWSAIVGVLVLEHFGKPRPSNKSTCHYIDGNPENLYIGNLEWSQTSRSCAHHDLDMDRGENYFKYRGIRSCKKCKRYPCMERQKNGLTSFDFGAYGCIDYKI
ncbi:MAG: NUMOD4 domain-containing protein [Clostridium sp.]